MRRVPATYQSEVAAFFTGVKAALLSVFSLVLMGTYVGMGALAQGVGLSVWWLTLSTVIVWAAPAQLILISAFATGGTIVEVAVAITLSATRLFPMVVALLPVLRGPTTRLRDMILPAHFTSISMWVESLRLLPMVDREHRVAFCNGLSVGYMGSALSAGFVGFYLAKGLPPLLAGVLLFLTPMSFFLSTVHNSRQMIDKVALILGLLLGPLLAWWQLPLDLMWTGVVGGTLAYGVHRLREAMR